MGTFLAILAAMMFVPWLVRCKELHQSVSGLLMAAASPFVWLYLWLVDPVYLRKGAAPQSSAPTWGNIALRWFTTLALALVLLWVGLGRPPLRQLIPVGAHAARAGQESLLEPHRHAVSTR